MKVKKIYKYGIIYEGEIESILIQNLRSKILNIATKTPCKCSNHNRSLNGTISKRILNDIISDSSSCCKRFLIIDKDSYSDEFINNLKKSKNFTLILSDPCIEIVLYAIFNHTESKLTKDVIEKKMNEILKSQYNVKYNHDVESTKKIFDIFDSHSELKEIWLNNIEKLNENNKSNFIEFINFLRE